LKRICSYQVHDRAVSSLGAYAIDSPPPTGEGKARKARSSIPLNLKGGSIATVRTCTGSISVPVSVIRLVPEFHTRY